MKKFFAFILVCIMSCCCFLFAGCELTKGPETYKFNAFRVSEGDNTITVEVNGKFNGIEIKEDTFILIMNSNSTFALCCNLSKTDADNNILESLSGIRTGTWMNGYQDAIYFTMSEETAVTVGRKIDDNTIVLDINENLQIRFKK